MININGKEWSILQVSDIEKMLNEKDTEESFFFEFKEDEVKPNKIVKEISALANSFGGYIFLGVSDQKEIKGCNNWNEQKIHTIIHDSITPTPSFDVRKFICNEKIFYIIKIDEGTEPPYITNKGKIYERLSSGSFQIKDSNKLSQLFYKRQQQLKWMEQSISIDPVAEDITKINNIFGYVDVGFTIKVTSPEEIEKRFFEVKPLKIYNRVFNDEKQYNLSYVGQSLMVVNNGMSVKNNSDSDNYGFRLPAHLSHFLEIMPNGYAKMRYILWCNDPRDDTINMAYNIGIESDFKKVYKSIFNIDFSQKFIYAKKYQKLTVIKQFHPFLHIEKSWRQNSKFQSIEKKIQKIKEKSEKIIGKDVIVANDRIPKYGLYTIDRQAFQKWKIDYTSENIINELFQCDYMNIGAPKEPLDF
ncbi:ATP-binding protein [Pseudoramibacter alactolyticus]|uniref:AlbA family DNA-binding domain-containing protein n=1 Tax=Pseudoramibacter alactolyticus TaxID=113287 RepID=UPI0028F0F732|nr:ATP-binding protein [Pseudoramibacter alactolyticus]